VNSSSGRGGKEGGNFNTPGRGRSLRERAGLYPTRGRGGEKKKGTNLLGGNPRKSEGLGGTPFLEKKRERKKKNVFYCVMCRNSYTVGGEKP